MQYDGSRAARDPPTQHPPEHGSPIVPFVSNAEYQEHQLSRGRAEQHGEHRPPDPPAGTGTAAPSQGRQHQGDHHRDDQTVPRDREPGHDHIGAVPVTPHERLAQHLGRHQDRDRGRADEQDERLPAAHRRGAGIIRESGEHLSAIIAGLLDISRIEAGRIELHRDRVRLPELLEGLAQMMRLQAEAKGLRLIYVAHGLPALVHCDEQRLQQILINLLSNAIKFTRAGEVRFTASWRAQIAEFAVADTGPGIAAADLSRIFEPFERASADTVPGVGLGLTITRLLTEILGGEITVRSQVG